MGALGETSTFSVRPKSNLNQRAPYMLVWCTHQIMFAIHTHINDGIYICMIRGLKGGFGAAERSHIDTRIVI